MNNVLRNIKAPQKKFTFAGLGKAVALGAVIGFLSIPTATASATIGEAESTSYGTSIIENARRTTRSTEALVASSTQMFFVHPNTGSVMLPTGTRLRVLEWSSIHNGLHVRVLSGPHSGREGVIRNTGGLR
ncbi:MAG: hypothetical protein FWF59_12395 [Turicibacter sp.]|nr:hypothetical protein [Turicibacter sp.]